MQVAVVSILLMVGACGAPAGDETSNSAGPSVTVRQANHQVDAASPDSNFAGNPYESCGPDSTGSHRRFPRVVFPWYSPVWLMHANAEFYPGNYARPYDYREKFDYPWNGPRPGGYARFGAGQFGPPPFEPKPFGPGFQDPSFGAPHLEPVPPEDDTSASNGPAERPARSVAPAPRKFPLP
jgi:hypothetical protein